MNVLKKTSSGFQSFPLETMLFDKRIIFLEDTITSESVNLIIKQLLFLEDVDRYEPIKLVINSGGGEINAGLNLYDAIQSCPCELNLICSEMAASMAAVLFASGKIGHRLILPHSRVMIHEPLIADEIAGSATSIEKTAQLILDVKKQMNELLAKHTGREISEIDRATAFDNYLSAAEAVKFGICDRIIEHI